MTETVIRVEAISKKYRLGIINRRQLVDQIESWLARVWGRPDPHASVFEKATDRMPTPYDFWALRDINFEVNRGDIVGIMGRNGSGKSTLLKLLSRITAPTSGKAFMKGRLASLLEVGTGFNHELSGRDNVYLYGSIMGLKNCEIDEKYSDIVDFSEIGDFMETPTKRYSSGMRVRLAFAVAAHLNPDILILDEVLAVGDAKFQQKCLNRINEIRESGVTILFVSHSADQVLKLCTKGILLHEGRIIGSGTAKQATDQYLKLLNIQNDIDDKGGQGSRAGMFSSKIAEFFARNLNSGTFIMNIPVETSQGNVPVELGWISNARLSTLRTEPSWSASPDIVVNIVTRSMTPEMAHELRMIHSKNGARESWIVFPDGHVDRYSDVAMKPIFKDFKLKTIISNLDLLLNSISD